MAPGAEDCGLLALLALLLSIMNTGPQTLALSIPRPITN